MTPIPTPHRGLRSRHDTGVFAKHALPGGITAWVQKPPVLLTEEGVLVAYFVGVGSALDPAGKEGLAHFLEHMPLKGTRLYPDKQALTEAVRNRGGGINAATSRYWTRYHVAMPGSSFPDALQVLSQLLTEPLMRPEDVEVERGVVESERKRKFENGSTLAAREVDELLFGNHPAIKWGIGTAASIQAITHADIAAFWKEHCHAGNLHLVVGGTFAEQPDLLARLAEAFAGVPPGASIAVSLPALPAPAPGRSAIVNPRYGRNRFYHQWIVPGAPTEASLDALALLASAYAGGSDSPLAVELRERRGLVYESGLMHGDRVGTVATEASLMLPIESGDYDSAMESALRLLRELPDERVATVLGRWQLGRLTDFHYPTSVCMSLGDELFTKGSISSIHEDEADADAIDLDLVHWWRDFLATTAPAVVETKLAADA